MGSGGFERSGGDDQQFFFYVALSVSEVSKLIRNVAAFCLLLYKSHLLHS